MANRRGKSGEVTIFFSWHPKSLQMVMAATKLKDIYSFGRKVMTNLDSIFKSRDITLLTKVSIVKGMVLPIVTYGVRAGSERRLSSEEMMLLNCSAGEDS